MPMADCLSWLMHCERRAASRAGCTAGKQQGHEHADDGDDDE